MAKKVGFNPGRPIRGYAISPSHMFSIINNRFNLGVGADTAFKGMMVYRLTGLSEKDRQKLAVRINRLDPDIESVNNILGRVKLNIMRADNGFRIVDIAVTKRPDAAIPAAPARDMTANEKFEEFDRAAKKAGDPFIEGFDSLDDTQKTDLAVRFSRRKPRLIVDTIARFGISEECLWASIIEQCCENKDGALETLSRWKELNMKEPDSIINVLTACATHGAATETAKRLNNVIIDDNEVRRIARLCMDNGGAREIAFSGNIVRKLKDADRTHLALLNVREQDENFVINHFSMFRLRYDADKAKVAAEHFTKNGWNRFSLDIDKFGITSAKELNRLAALWMISRYEERLDTKIDESEKQFSNEDLATLETVANILCRRLRGNHDNDLDRVLSGFMMDHYTEGVPMFGQLVELMRKKQRDDYWGTGFRF